MLMATALMAPITCTSCCFYKEENQTAFNVAFKQLPAVTLSAPTPYAHVHCQRPLAHFAVPVPRARGPGAGPVGRILQLAVPPSPGRTEGTADLSPSPPPSALCAALSQGTCQPAPQWEWPRPPRWTLTAGPPGACEGGSNTGSDCVFICPTTSHLVGTRPVTHWRTRFSTSRWPPVADRSESWEESHTNAPTHPASPQPQYVVMCTHLLRQPCPA